jgi:hypothetical protein
MKLAALDSQASRTRRPKPRRAASIFDATRDWTSNYEGFPNTAIVDVRLQGNLAIVTLQQADGNLIERTVSGFACIGGRRGSLKYLDEALRHEEWDPADDSEMLSGQSLRERALENLEVAPGVFIIGSLTGDSLIRIAFGSCTYAAGNIMQPDTPPPVANGHKSGSRMTSKTGSPFLQTTNGLDQHNGSHVFTATIDQPLDRRKDEE